MSEEIVIGKLVDPEDWDNDDTADEPQPVSTEPLAQKMRHLLRPGSDQSQLEPDAASDEVRIGLDVGKSNDPTSAAVVQPIEFATGYIECFAAHSSFESHDPDYCFPEMKTKYALRSLRTIPLGMDYPEQVRRVIGDIAYPLLDRPGVRAVTLYVDATGIGKGFVDGLNEYLMADGTLGRVRVMAVSITAGGPEVFKPGSSTITVSKSHLMTRLQSVVGMGYLEWSKKLREANALADEIRTMEVVFPDAYGQTTVKYQASGANHDDRVLALALAVLQRPGGHVRFGPSFWT